MTTSPSTSCAAPGFNAVLPKPFSLPHLESLVRTLTGEAVYAHAA
jgi:hypothetical protein